MKKRSGSATLSYADKLRIIEEWTVRFAQCFVSGTIASPNAPYGDLLHKDGTYSEVKGAGNSAGAIIRRTQLRRHLTGPTRDYVIVFRQNRAWKDGRWHYHTLQRARNKRALEQHLLEAVTSVCIVHKTGMEILYKKLRRHEQTHNFKAGPKSYIKMRPNHLWRLLLSGFERGSQIRTIQFDGKSLGITEITIPAKK